MNTIFFLAAVISSLLLASPTHASVTSTQNLTVFPVEKVPDWGAMRSAAEWNRTYAEMDEEDFIQPPLYDLSRLTIPVADLVISPTKEKISILTSKLTYSTRFFGAYDIDATEFTAAHPGIDIKLPAGTPIRAIAEGKVHAVRRGDLLGLHLIIEHQRNQETFYSIYGHMGTVSVSEGDRVFAGDFLGEIGMTGSTSNPHLHLQVDRGRGNREHIPYAPTALPTPAEAARFTVHPIQFIDAS